MKLHDIKKELELIHPQSLAWALGCTKWKTEEAKDVLQAAYLKVLDGSAVFGGRSSLKTWFFSVIRLTAHERNRRSWTQWKLLKSNQEAGLMNLADNGPKDSDWNVRETLLRAIKKLSPQQQRIIELVFFHDLTLEEASEVMGIQLGSVRTHYARAKEILARNLKQEDYL